MQSRLLLRIRSETTKSEFSFPFESIFTQPFKKNAEQVFRGTHTVLTVGKYSVV